MMDGPPGRSPSPTRCPSMRSFYVIATRNGCTLLRTMGENTNELAAVQDAIHSLEAEPRSGTPRTVHVAAYRGNYSPLTELMSANVTLM
jgi:hypothetical protein